MMDTVLLLELFLLSCAAGIVLAMTVPERSAPFILAWTASISSAIILIAGGIGLFTNQPFQAELWRISSLGTMGIGMDRLSALFVFMAGLVFLPVSVFSARYMQRYSGRYSLRSFSIFYHLLFASVVLLLIAADVLSFLLAWEVMSILCYLLINYEHEKQENTRSGLLMLVMGEAGFISVVFGFLLLTGPSGGLDFASLRLNAGSIGGATRWVIFLLTFFGFGIKAGIIPVNTWLPKAYEAVPGNIAAILSGVTLNLAVYGIIRINADILPALTAGPGIVALITGSLSALIGILYATTEDDMQKMLAHSSIENAGIIIAGLGAGMVFTATNHPVLAGIAFIASLYHMINHSMFKTLLFLGSSGIEMKTGGRDMNRLGGLNRFMPWTGAFFLIGALSIAALPPFNGFVSEWLTLQTMLQSASLQSIPVKITFALSGAALALTAGLAVTCFVKAFAMSFLGMGRSESSRRTGELPWSMRSAMGFLAFMCIVLGIFPTYVIPVLDRTITPIVHESAADALVPPFFTVGRGNKKFGRAFVSDFHKLGAQVGSNVLPGRGLVVLHRGGRRNPVVFAMSTSYTFVVLLLLLGATLLMLWILVRRRKVRYQPAWDGGLRRLPSHMTYTATGFSNPVRVIFSAVFHPTVTTKTREAVAEHFRTAITKERREVHITERLILQPVVSMLRGVSGRIAKMHSGSVNIYAMYVIITLILLLIGGQSF
ncbi:Hydrogenase-4 component B [hydrothermal vent metagenome]|uniref:Hydrogenase-4 component B n=1 Tax=hydrothermal vent metagenome TaxID=652676 RepID=A0A3B0VN33_9ZZZZ